MKTPLGKTPKRVLLLDERTGYGFGSCMINAMAHLFLLKGLNPIILNLTHADFPRQFAEIYSHKHEFLFAFCMVRGMDKDRTGKCLHEYLDIPLFAAFGDHPLYKYHFIDFTMKSVVYGFNDPHHVAFCQAHLGKDCYVHFPHFRLVPPMRELTKEEFLKREKSLIFPAGAAIMNREWSINADSGAASEVLQELERSGIKIASFIEHFLYDGSHLDKALLSFWKMYFSDVKLQHFARIFCEVDVLVRSLRRKETIKALDGLPLTVIGHGWASCTYLGNSVKILAATDYVSCESLRKKYQLTLHTSQLQPNAGHDRIIHAMSAGQGVLAETTPYLESESLRDCVELFSVKLGNVRETYVKLLADDDKRFEICCKALQVARDSWPPSEAIANTVIDALRVRNLLKADPS